MKRSVLKKQRENWAKFMFRLAWHRLRDDMRDPCVIAWRMDPTRTFTCTDENRPYVRAAHTAMYDRELAKAYPLERLHAIRVGQHTGRWTDAAFYRPKESKAHMGALR